MILLHVVNFIVIFVSTVINLTLQTFKWCFLIITGCVVGTFRDPMETMYIEPIDNHQAMEIEEVRQTKVKPFDYEYCTVEGI